MKYFIFSDIHANLQALQAVLARARTVGYDRCICLGDVMGYNANPIECWDLVSEYADVILLGNHERGIRAPMAETNGRVPRLIMHWTHKLLKDAGRTDILNQLEELPYQWSDDSVRVVHSSPNRPEDFTYVQSEETAREALNEFDESCCFIGHVHVPYVYSVVIETNTFDGYRDIKQKEYGKPVALSPERRCLINVGSVGQPRDGNPRARFVTYDSDTRELTYYQEDYDIRGARKALLHSSMPHDVSLILAERLVVGR